MAVRWYVAQTKPGESRLAFDHLARQSFMPYLPELNSKLLLPGYIFVAFDIDRDEWRPINSTTGVKKLLPVHREIPIAMPDEFIPDISGVIAQGGIDEDGIAQLRNKYVRGQEVKITGGAFAGHTARYVKSQKKVVELLLYLLGAEVVVQVGLSQVAPT